MITLRNCRDEYFRLEIWSNIWIVTCLEALLRQQN